MTIVSELDTPSVTILLDRLEANIARAQRLTDAQGIGNRPHIKTHKIPEIAAMQIAAGASGITCQKLGEVEVFIEAGVTDDILLTFNIIGDAKTDRLMELSQRIKRLAVVADNEVVLRGLSEAGVRHGRDVPVLIECDGGIGRNGVQTPEGARALAQMATNLPRMRFEGLMVFPNKGPEVAAFMTKTLELLEADGIPVPVVSGGGTPGLNTLADFPMMTEHRAGTYVYNDQMMVEAGAATLDDCAMHVRATVVSMPTPDRAIIDAGSKVLTKDQYTLPNYGQVVEHPGAVVADSSEEHGMLDLSRAKTKPQIGEVVSVIPNHCCVVSNMVDEVYGVRDGAVETVWPVAARGKVR